MNFHSNVSSFAQQQSSTTMFDPEPWRKPYGHLGAQTFAANAELNGHYGVVYPANALGLTSDVHQVNRDSDHLPTQTTGGYYFNDAVVHPVSDSVERSLFIIDRLFFRWWTGPVSCSISLP
jgi:hypothetical protein